MRRLARTRFDTSALGPHRWFANAAYLGGSERFPPGTQGVLFFTTKAIGLGRQMPGAFAPVTGPEQVLLPIGHVESIEVTGRAIATSRLIPVLLLGVLGLAAKASKMQTTVVVRTTDEEALYFLLDHQAPEQVKALLTPHLKRVGVPFHDEPSSGPADVADEIRKLAALRDDGVLTQDEFERRKAKLLR
jgi:hypothetical protein